MAGALCIFAPREHEAEFSAWVVPDLRRQGLFSALFHKALNTVLSYGYSTILLVHDPREPVGATIAQKWNCTLHHSEYSMVHHPSGDGSPPAYNGPELSFRKASIHDRAGLVATQAGAFGGEAAESQHIVDSFLLDPNRQIHLGCIGTDVISSASLYFEPDQTSINALAVLPALQGRGIGRQFLGYLVKQCPRTIPVALDVDVANPRALGLYTSCGFTVVRQADYYSYQGHLTQGAAPGIRV